MQARSLGQEDSLEEGMATHSNILTWRTPWTEELDRLQFIGLQSQTRLRRLSLAQYTTPRMSFVHFPTSPATYTTQVMSCPLSPQLPCLLSQHVCSLCWEHSSITCLEHAFLCLRNRLVGVSFKSGSAQLLRRQNSQEMKESKPEKKTECHQNSV